jgi:hypothetical protein
MGKRWSRAGQKGEDLASLDRELDVAVERLASGAAR